jgi:site-specific DNA-cytosine methylase
MPETQQLTAVDLFAGVGGLSLGARRAGFDVPLAVEIDKQIAPTYPRTSKTTPGGLRQCANDRGEICR